MRMYYCWRCKRDVPMLEEHEWEQMLPVLRGYIEQVKRLCKEDALRLFEAERQAGNPACNLYFELTGYRETEFDAIWHHRLADYGPECPRCGHLLRTPQATFCAKCGCTRDQDGKAAHHGPPASS